LIATHQFQNIFLTPIKVSFMVIHVQMPDRYNLKRLQETLSVRFDNGALLQEALTHSSYVNENPQAVSNERLEFVGDAVLGLILAEKLFLDYPELAEGELTRMRSQLVRRTTLAVIARSISLGDYLHLGRGETASGGKSNTANLAGALEAVFAAVYLDQTWDITRSCVIRIFEDELERIHHEHYGDDYKSRLQELTQLRFRATPFYHIVGETGPEHARQFTAEVIIRDEVLSRGEGRSKKLAEAEAAREALAKLGQSPTP
jgi:ribonuclease-3